MTATVRVAFRDRNTWIVYAPGDTYAGDESRVAELRSLGILSDAVATDARQDVANPSDDLSALTVAQLRELCEERGIDAPKRATKAQLITILTD